MIAPKPLPLPHVCGDPEGFFEVEGGVCAAKGMVASGVHAGFRKNPERRDLALVASEDPAVMAATFTRNRFCAAPVQLSRERAAKGIARAVVLNSGNANAATGAMGLEVARASAALAARELGCPEEQVLVASTGVIGQQLSLGGFEKGVPIAVERLRSSSEAAHDAALAVMTTDTHPKEAALRGTVSHGGRSVEVSVGGFVKGSGMIQPNMATMLAVISTDAPLTHEAALLALRRAVGVSFNRVTVDSDTSTNDSCFLFATGAAGGEPIAPEDGAFAPVAEAIRAVCERLARQIAADGEGATRLITVDVTGAASDAEAELVARAVANSPLVKTCVAGHDANWGRVAAAAGKAGVAFDQTRVDIDFLGAPVCRGGLAVDVDEDEMLRRFEGPEVPIAIDLGQGAGTSRIWTCDLTHDYISINADYRT